jgi:hypothetical protein
MNGIGFRFGALSDPLKVQLDEQKAHVPPLDVLQFQQDANAITRLSLRGLITDGQTRAARQKLTNRIAKAAKAKP